MATVGFIGLGIMGRPMAKNAVKGGFKVIGTDVNTAIFPEMEAAGVSCVKTNAEVAAQSDIIIAILPTPAISLDVALGEDGILNKAKAGSLYIEMSSLTPVTVRKIHDALAQKSISMLDAPVSGGEPKAIDGTLAIMAGGSQKNFERAKPVFNSMASTVTRVGDIGAGCMTKLANQIIVGVNIAAVAEAFALAAKGGVDPAVVFEAIRGGFAGSAVLEAKGPMMLDQNFTPGARMEIHIKDLVNVLETAHAIGAPTPLAAQVMEMMQSIKANGMGNIDHSGLVKFYEMIGNVEVKRG